jgi:hypothetical protein
VHALGGHTSPVVAHLVSDQCDEIGGMGESMQSAMHVSYSSALFSHTPLPQEAFTAPHRNVKFPAWFDLAKKRSIALPLVEATGCECSQEKMASILPWTKVLS